MTRLYFAENGSKQWKRLKEAAVLNFSKSNGAFYFNLIDVNEKNSEWSQEIYLDFKYHRDMECFHSFEGDKGMFGILFADTNEADNFYETIITELEIYTVSEKMPAKSRSKSKSIFGVFSFGRRSSKNNEAEAAEEEEFSEDKEKPETQKAKRKKEKKNDPDLSHEDVSEPRDFTHLSHIGFNPTKGTFDIENIPDEWKTTFAKAGITHDQLENRTTAKFIASFVQDSEPQMKSITSKRPAPVPLKKKAPPPPPSTPIKNKNLAPLPSPKKTFLAGPPPPPPKKASSKSKSGNGAPIPPPPSQSQAINSNIPKPPAGTSTHSALLESIKGSGIGILKPVNLSDDSGPASPSISSNPHSALMASIKGGTSLRPTSKVDKSPSSPTSSLSGTDPTDMMAAMLAKALAARNKKLAAESSDDDDSDDSRW